MRDIRPYYPIEPKSHLRTAFTILRILGWQGCLFIVGYCLMIGSTIVMEILIRLNSTCHSYAFIGALVGFVILLLFFVSLNFWPPRFRPLSREEIYAWEQKWEQEKIERRKNDQK